MPTRLHQRKAKSGSDRYCEGVLESAVSLARGMLHRGNPGTEESSPSPPSPTRNAYEWDGGKRNQGSTGGSVRGDGAVLQPHSTEEGGEPQGSRKGFDALEVDLWLGVGM